MMSVISMAGMRCDARLLVPCVILIGCADPKSPNPEVPAWEAVPGAPTLASNRFDDITFVGSVGWLSGNNAATFRTTDGGATWTEVSGFQFRAVGFATTDLGWGGRLNTENTPGVALFETADGGATWTNATEKISGADVAGICGIWVQDASTIFAVGRWFGPARFLRSIDGGQSWESRDMSAVANGLVDVRFFSPSLGFVAGQRFGRPVILRTTDGGNSWSTVYLGDHADSRVWKLSFPTSDVGYGSVLGAGAPGIIVRTTDGGSTWSELPVAPGTEFFGVGFRTSLVGWAASPSQLFETAGGGETWKALPLGERVNRIRFVDPTLGFAAGATVYRHP